MKGGTAFLFPGQGTDLSALGHDHLTAPGPVQDLVAVASDVLAFDVARALRVGDPRLTGTEFGQPVLVAVTLGLAQEKERGGLTATAVAGHSLGELTAAAFAGCLGAEDAIRAAAARGRLMGAAAWRWPGSMGAVCCDSQEALDDLLAAGRKQGVLELAARNTRSQWVLTGDRAALGAVARLTPLTLLPVTGPWHSQAMREAAADWLAVLRSYTWCAPGRLLVLSGSGRALSDGDDLPGSLAAHLCQPVQWVQTLECLRACGVSRFVPLGPGRVLRNLCREVLAGAGEAVVTS